MIMIRLGSASDSSLGSRVETALAAGRDAGPVVDMRQHSVVSDVDGGVALRTETAKKNTIREKVGSVPRFLVVKRKEGNFEKVSPFFISKTMFGLVGELKSIKKLREGLLIECVSAAQASRLLKITRLRDIEVEVVPHATLNVSKGVVTCKDLLNCTTDEILEELKEEGVTLVKRIFVRRNGTLQETATHILTFNTPVLPQKIKVAFYSLPVRPYIPIPVRCFRCQRFGHTSQKCSNEQICVCGEKPHDGTPCEQPIKCVNCKGPHSARSKLCPVFKQENTIQRVKTLGQLSYVEAKKIVMTEKTPITGKSYAQTTACNTSSVSPEIVKEVVNNLTPIIVSAVKKELVTDTFKSQTLKDSDVTLPQKYATKNETASVSVKKGTQARTAIHEITSDMDSSDDTKWLQSRQKKKKGWPKGKPRGPKKKILDVI